MSFPVHELFFQLAPIACYEHALKELRTEDGERWPSPAAQAELVRQLDPQSHSFIVSESDACSATTLLPPLSYQKAILRYIEKHARTSSVEETGEESFDDEFIEHCLRVFNASDSEHAAIAEQAMLFSTEIERQHIGFASYPAPLRVSSSSHNAPTQLSQPSQLPTQPSRHTAVAFPPRIPLLVKKSFTQVGTKVWGAGLFLAELFQSLTLRDAAVWRERVLYELGAGVGVTGLLLGRGLPKDTQPRRIVMTDCFEEVLDVLRYNVSLSPAEGECELLVEHCDWADERETLRTQLRQHAPHCLFAADCTYSEDLNLLLVSLFELFLADDDDDNNGNTDKDSNGEDEFLPLRLLREERRFVLIACTIRHPETFRHFETHVAASPLLQVRDVSEDAHKLISSPWYWYEWRENIMLFCITGKK